MKSSHNKIGSSVQQSVVSASNAQLKRVPFKMVRSTFEPPEQTEPTINYLSDQLSEGKSQKKISQIKNYNQIESQILSSYTQVSFNPNIEFISSLISIKQLQRFDEGDCIPIDNDDRWVIVNGQVKIVGNNLSSFSRKEGFVFFASAQTKKKIKQIVAISSTSALRIPQSVFKESVRNFLYIKNAEKIKFLQYCPFLAWTHSIAQDISISMDSISHNEKQAFIYKQGQEANEIYFVKQGIVLLERSGKTSNQVILDYQKHYQASYLNEDEGLIIVRKGMIFGVDGILIKQINKELDLLATSNPEVDLRPYQEKQKVRLKSNRIYSAKSIGKCQLYKIDKSVLDTYLKSNGTINFNRNKQQFNISNKQLDRICQEYTNILMGSSQISKELKKKNFEFKISKNEGEMEEKRRKVEEMKMQEKKLRRVNINSEIRKVDHTKEDQLPIVMRSPRKNKISIDKKLKDVSLPSLNKKYVEKLIYKKLEAQQIEKYIIYKKKVETSILGKDIKQTKATKKQIQKGEKGQKADNSQFMKVKSYRSLLSSLS